MLVLSRGCCASGSRSSSPSPTEGVFDVIVTMTRSHMRHIRGRGGQQGVADRRTGLVAVPVTGGVPTTLDETPATAAG